MSIIRRMGMKRANAFSATLLALALGATACVSDDPVATGPQTTNLRGSDIQLTSALETVGDCDTLLSRLIDEGLERVGPYGFNNGGYYGWPVEMMEDDAMTEGASDGADTAGAPATTTQASSDDSGRTAGGGEEFSGTNNQESGVDESDIVKTDGSRLITVNGNKLRILDVTGSTPKLLSTTSLPDEVYGGELFLAGDTALLMTTGWSATPLLSSRSVIGYPGVSTTRILTVDMTNGEIGRTIEFSGNYLSAREIDGTVRIVANSSMGNDFPWIFPSGPSAEETAEKANRDLLRNSTIEDWLPSFRVLDGKTVVSEGMIAPCERIHLPSEFAGFGTLAVMTVDATNGFELGDTLGVVTDGQTVYASTDRLTVATPRYPEWDPQTGELVEDNDEYRTALHTFDISEPMSTSYVASGSVPGYLLSRFSLSEHNGYLRVATTSEGEWNRGNSNSESSLAVLEERGGQLVEVGRVDGLGKGERIFAVRYQGDVAYVVTFRQTDPLYVIDISEPTNPIARGELKINGFSTYLHPLPDGQLLGIGQDATDEGRTIGGQLSLFDVTNPDDPTRMTTFDLGKNSHSIVDWDPRAFTWWPATQTAFVPTSWWNWDEATRTDESGNAVIAVRIADGEFTELGRISHPVVEQCERDIYFPDEPIPVEPLSEDGAATDAEANFAEEEPPPTADAIEPGYEDYCWKYAPEIRRSVIIGDNILTISEAGIASHNLDDFSSNGSFLKFEN